MEYQGRLFLWLLEHSLNPSLIISIKLHSSIPKLFSATSYIVLLMYLFSLLAITCPRQSPFNLDDPVMWGFKGFPITDDKLARWVLAAEDICFKNPLFSYFFRLGKCIPITRGGGIYQDHMNEALDRLTEGAWLHTFPEGKVCQEDAPIRRLKWGTASLIARAPVTPIVLPIVHRGFEEVMPESYMFGKKPPIPLFNKDIRIVIGEPITFDIPVLKQKAIVMSKDLPSFHHSGWPNTTPCGLNVAAQACLYSTISDQIRGAMERLRNAIQTCPMTKG